MSHRVFVVAGEPSGDLHGSMFIGALKKLCSNRVDFMGLGGARMAAQGLESIYPMEHLSVVGLMEVVTHGKAIFQAYKAVKKALMKWRPDLVVFIDYPGFNLRMLRFARRIGLTTMYYITPQVWAWKKGRVRTLRECCHAAAVILPFEEAFLKAHGVRARFVGHPLLDVVHSAMTSREFLSSVGLDPEKETIGLMPGSRRGELKRHLPLMVRCARAMGKERPRYQFLMPITDRGLLTGGETREIESANIRLITGMTYDAMASCHCLLLASGTVTLEASILGVPHVVMYRLSPMTYMLGRLLVRVPYISLTNLVAGKKVVDEFIQDKATVENLKEAIIEILEDDTRRSSLKEALQEVRSGLGPGGASLRAATLAMELMGQAEPLCPFLSA